MILALVALALSAFQSAGDVRGIPSDEDPARPAGTQLDTQPRVTFMPDVSQFYPAESLAADEQGQTRLRCTLTEAGVLTDCRVQSSSGWPRLDEAAFQIAARARYTPPLRAGVPVAAPVILPVTWKIAD